MPRTPFGKTATVAKPYAVYVNERAGWIWKVLKTYQHPDNEGQYSRWMVHASSPMCPSGEFGDTYADDVKQQGRLVIGSSTDEWIKHYA